MDYIPTHCKISSKDLVCLPCSPPQDLSCRCARSNFLNSQVEAIFDQIDGKKYKQQVVTHPVRRQITSNFGEGIQNALNARAVCRKIAKDHPNYPITAIANAAWQGQPDLMQGDSLNALARLHSAGSVDVPTFLGVVATVGPFRRAHRTLPLRVGGMPPRRGVGGASPRGRVGGLPCGACGLFHRAVVQAAM